MWTLVPVEGETDTYNIIFKDRKEGCLRYLGAPTSCSDKYVRLYAKDDGSGAQRWVIKAVNPAKPSPNPKPTQSPSAATNSPPIVNNSPTVGYAQ